MKHRHDCRPLDHAPDVADKTIDWECDCGRAWTVERRSSGSVATIATLQPEPMT